MPREINRIKEILKMLEESTFNEIEWEETNFKIKVKRHVPLLHEPIAHQTHQHILTEMQRGLPGPHAKHETEIELTEGRAVIKSPLVGTFYRSPSPNASPFVDIGDAIKPGQVLCIIEAMKLMNEVECDRMGKIAAILVENAQPVEYGEPLFIIET